MKKLNIFVYGSFDGRNEEIKEICRSLGKLLYGKGHTFSIITTMESAIDRYFIEGVKQVKNKYHPIKVFKDKNHTNIDENYLTSIAHDIIGNEADTIKVAHVQAILNADVVFTLAGTNPLDKDVNELVEVLKKPILVINNFEGSSKTIFNRLDLFYKDFFNHKDYNFLTKTKAKDKSTEWIASLLEKISGSTMFQGMKKTPNFPTFIFTFLWLLTLLSPLFFSELEPVLFLLFVFQSIFVYVMGVNIRRWLLIRKRKKEHIEESLQIPFGITILIFFFLIVLVNWLTISNNDTSFPQSVAHYLSLSTVTSIFLFFSSTIPNFYKSIIKI